MGTKSVGYLELRSADPSEPPALDPNYLADESDMDVLVEGVKLGRRILQSRAFDRFRGEESGAIRGRRSSKRRSWGLGNGLALGAIGAGVAWLRSGNIFLGLNLALAMVINLLVAAVAATLIPIALRALKVDPARASAVFITTLTDMFGFFAFLGLATIFLQYIERMA